MRHRVCRTLIIIALLILAGCEPALPTQEAVDRDLPTQAEDEQLPLDERAQALIELAKADLARKQGVDTDDIFLQSVESVEFSDASLGVPEPGKTYAQVVTPGYIIRLIVGGKVYKYHGSGDHAVLVPEDRAPTSTPGDVAPTPDVVTLFFGNESRSGDADTAPHPCGPYPCDAVFPVVREVPATYDLPRAALEQLFAGPTEAEREQGYTSLFSQATQGALRSLTFEGDTAYIDLIDVRPLIPSANASCAQQAFFAQVETTLRKARPVTRAIYAIEGEPAVFYEWMQLGCSEANDNCDPTPFQARASTMTPDEVAASFYSWYLDRPGQGDNPLFSKSYHSNGHLSEAFIRKVDAIIASSSRGAYDPFLCAQDIPRDMRLDPAEIEGDVAQIGVHGIWNPGSEYESTNNITVYLERVRGQWKIVDINCN